MFKRYGLAILTIALMSTPAFAQVDGAVASVKDYFVNNQARYGVSSQDLSDLIVSDAYHSRRSGATYVYLKQSHNEFEIVNARAQAAVSRGGDIVAPVECLIADVEERVNTTESSLSNNAAGSAAVRHLVQTVRRPDGPILTSDTPGETVATPGSAYNSDSFLPDLEQTRLVYYATISGEIILSWEIMVDSRFGHMWLVYVDANTGRGLHVASLTDSDNWGTERPRPASAVSLAPVQAQQAHVASAVSGTYNVFALPAESPNHGPQTSVVTPHDATASQLGWHDTGSNSYTITRGNNVFAYEDRDANNSPGFSPDGGGSLVFDYPFDPNEAPVDYQDLAVTNLFYWNNIVHDVMYRYGFDEPSGNFQINNFGSGGNGNDYVLAEAQDGSGTNNANFSTPPDGGPGRMQMYEWTGGSFEVTAPSSIAGIYATGGSQFGAVNYDVAGEIVLLETVEGDPADGCSTANINPSVMDGKFALILRGNCNFIDKARIAEDAGAIGLLVYNCEVGSTGCSATSEDEIITMALPDGETNDVTIPCQFVPRPTALDIIAELPGVMTKVVGGARDSDLDSGVIIHEYGHGISNRLTGGPGASGCLSNAEQMGEGWSDYFGLMLTQQPGDTAAQPRGVGTYLQFETTDGVGIRPAPYSTDMGINNYTYDDTRTGGLSVPHGIGFVWATMLWEMTWDLIDVYGYDPDVYDAEGTAGNQIALQLVTEGLKLQPCSPGFVDGRDAILEADELLYDGANYHIIWEAFARRGLGLDADQGSSDSNADNFGDFTFPVANEAGTNVPVGYVLSQAYPNPFNPQAQFTLQIDEVQNVRIEVIDALGRQVALLHDGQLASGVSHRFTIDGTNLASGLYTYRVIGENFSTAKRVTLVK